MAAIRCAFSPLVYTNYTAVCYQKIEIPYLLNVWMIQFKLVYQNPSKYFNPVSMALSIKVYANSINPISRRFLFLFAKPYNPITTDIYLK